MFVGVFCLAVFFTSALMAAEAYAVGAGTAADRTRKGKKRDGPITWFLFGLLLWAVAFPWWMHRRWKYGLRNLCGAAILAVLLLLSAAVAVPLAGGLRLTTTELQTQVQQSIQETWAKEPTLAGAQINSFTLIHKSGNEYEGLLEITRDGETEKLKVDVTFDGRQFMWKVRE